MNVIQRIVECKTSKFKDNPHNKAINADSQWRRSFVALLLAAGSGERWRV